MSLELDIHLTDIATGKVNRLTHWTDYAVISDLMNPADTFSATLAAVRHQREFTAHGGQKAQVFTYGALQSTAITDERSEACSGNSTDLQITGRGVGALLLDNVVDSSVLSMSNLTLDKIADRITKAWQPTWITGIETNNSANRYLIAGARPKYTTKTTVKKVYWAFDGKTRTTRANAAFHSEETIKSKVPIRGKKKKFGKNSPVYRGITSEKVTQNKIGPEEKVWEVILRLSRQIAAHPFVGADGTLIITRPCYDFDSSVYGDGIVQKWNKKANRATGGNVMRSQFETSIASRNSEIMAWATVKPKKTTIGKAAISHTWSVKDPSPAFWERSGNTLGANIIHRPDRIIFKTFNDPKMIRRRVRTLFEERCIGGFSLEYQIKGHTINGVMPVTDSMINVHDERYDLTGQTYYITRVERKANQSDGRHTVIHLKPAKIWLYFDHDATGDAEYNEHMAQRVFW